MSENWTTVADAEDLQPLGNILVSASNKAHQSTFCWSKMAGCDQMWCGTFMKTLTSKWLSQTQRAVPQTAVRVPSNKKGFCPCRQLFAFLVTVNPCFFGKADVCETRIRVAKSSWLRRSQPWRKKVSKNKNFDEEVTSPTKVLHCN